MFIKVVIAACLLAHPALSLEFGSGKIGDRLVTTIHVDPAKDDLRLFHKDEKQPLKRLDHLAEWRRTKDETVLFAMNAGMYHGDFSPVGLCVENGHRITPLNLAGGKGNFFLKPNGVFLLTSQGPAVLESSEVGKLKEPLLLATQSGPLLLRRGQIHPVFVPQSKNKLIRNGVGVTAQGMVVFAISEAPVSFHEFAIFFRDQMHCPDALFLDGTVSSLYAPALKRNDFRMDLGPMIGVVKVVK